MKEDVYTNELRDLTNEADKIKTALSSLVVDYNNNRVEFSKKDVEHGDILVNFAIGRVSQAQVSKVFKEREKLGKWLDDHEKMVKFGSRRVSRIEDRKRIIASIKASVNIKDKDDKEVNEVLNLYDEGVKPAKIVKITGLARERVSEIIFSEEEDD